MSNTIQGAKMARTKAAGLTLWRRLTQMAGLLIMGSGPITEFSAVPLWSLMFPARIAQ